ncbi:transient receptor potential cation channel subfamily A member 1 homolog [Lytechinus variegatus]|uniref:transient receptor potential cation channel subfamily A member 1 homolog n=1 Tax=Lytechinus variegatus TaxID=7654 RepID=UPI001BB18EC3|nr:transient receptor potential cation channel subfamily A member 1 homolog [Lytechinus variegatus]
MMKRYPLRFQSHAVWNPSQRKDSSTDSSDEEEEGRGAPSHPFTDKDSGSETESDSSQSESEPKMPDGRARFISLARRVRENSLLKLVNFKSPDIEKAKRLLANLTPEQISNEIATKDGRGNSIIHYACMKVLIPWVEMLIHHGADLNVRGAGGKRPIHLAVRDEVRLGQRRDQAQLVNLLVANEVQVNVKDNQGQTPLQVACKFDGQKMLVRALLSHPKILVDQPVKFGGVNSTLLNILCHYGQFESALLLLKHGATPLTVNAAKNTPLYIILKKGNVEYAQRFLSDCQRKGYDMQKILLAKNIYQKTVLHEVIKTGSEKLIKYCMLHVSPQNQEDGASVNYLLHVKSRYGSTIMHTACKQGHLDILHMLHDLCPPLLYTKNSKGLTPLHYACRGNHAEVTEEICIMYQRHDMVVKLNLKDYEDDGSPSLLKFTALKGSSDSLVVLLKHINDSSILIELTKWISVEKNLSLVLQELLNRFDDLSIGCESMEMEKSILRCAEKGQTESLLEFASRYRRSLHLKDPKSNSIMHLIALGGHLDTAKAILKIMDEDDIRLCEKNSSGQTPLHLSIKGGHKLTTKLFLKTDKSLVTIQDNNEMTPLMYACKVGNVLIVEMLLEQGQDQIKFFECDMKGRNCLDHAIRNGHEMVAVTLLSQEKWRDLMTHSTGKGANKTTPMRELITTMPGVCRFVLDKCITKVTDENTDDTTSEKIKVDYELLEDWFSDWMQSSPTSGLFTPACDLRRGTGGDLQNSEEHHPSYFDPCSSSPSTLSEMTLMFEKNSNFYSDGRLKENAVIYVTDPVYRSQNHPLRLMIQNDDSKMLLNHPVVRLMFRYKYNSTRLKYWISLFLRLTLVILVTGHSLVIPPSFYIETNEDGTNYTWLADGRTKWLDNMNPSALVFFGQIGTWIIIGLTLIYFIELTYRVWIHRQSKLDSIRGLASIVREMALLTFIILFVIPGLGEWTYAHGVMFKPDWQWQLGAFAVFLTWFNFIIFLQTTPLVGLYIFMFLEVLSTILKFISVVGIFIFAFAVVFCILLLNQDAFHTMGNSIAIILSMATGELNFDTVFHSLDYLYQPVASIDFTNIVFYPASTHIIFFLFIIFMPILVTNLLTALAVYDVEIIQKKANMYKRTLEAKGILDVQDNSVILLWKHSVLRDEVKSIRTEISPMHKLYYKAIGYKEIHDQLVAFLEELEKTGSVQFTKTPEKKIEDMAENISDIRNKLIMLSENAIDWKIEQLETMNSMQELKHQMQSLQDKIDSKIE